MLPEEKRRLGASPCRSVIRWASVINEPITVVIFSVTDLVRSRENSGVSGARSPRVRRTHRHRGRNLRRSGRHSIIVTVVLIRIGMAQAVSQRSPTPSSSPSDCRGSAVSRQTSSSSGIHHRRGPKLGPGLVRPAAVLIDPVPAGVAKTGSDSRICIVAISLGFTETIAVVVYLGAWQVSPITVLVDTIITGFQSAGSSPKVIVITIPIAWTVTIAVLISIFTIQIAAIAILVDTVVADLFRIWIDGIVRVIAVPVIGGITIFIQVEIGIGLGVHTRVDCGVFIRSTLATFNAAGCDPCTAEGKKQKQHEPIHGKSPSAVQVMRVY